MQKFKNWDYQLLILLILLIGKRIGQRLATLARLATHTTVFHTPPIDLFILKRPPAFTKSEAGFKYFQAT